jgi:hypothetical protein
MAGADVLVDVTNSPSFEDDPVMQFFTTSTTNLVAAAKEAQVGYYVVLSIVGVDGLPESGYMRAQKRVYDIRAVIEVPWRDDQRDHGANQAAALEVDVPRSHVGQVICWSGSDLAVVICHMQVPNGHTRNRLWRRIIQPQLLREHGYADVPVDVSTMPFRG